MALIASLVSSGASGYAQEAVQPATIGERLMAAQLTPEAIFKQPETEFERAALEAGKLFWWTSYGKTEAPTATDFKGYVLYADPFHKGLGRISFLIGADCSHFVQRIYQLFGADVTYAKTRHLIRLAQSSVAPADKPVAAPTDLSACRWQELKDSFDVVTAPKAADFAAGDWVIWNKAVSEHGEHGHVALVLGQAGVLTLLHAKSHRAGIVAEAFNVGESEPYARLRWKRPLRAVLGRTLPELLTGPHAADPTACPQ